MAIADKLTYLNTTKTLLREAITRAGHYLTEADPFRSYPYALLKDEHSLSLDFLRGEYVAKNWRDGTVSRVGFDSIISFTRGSGGGRFNHLGVYEWVGNDVARIDHDPATVDTSTSPLTIGSGLKTFAVSRLYPVGEYVRATADASNWVSGRVVASTGSSVTLWVDRVVGTGTFTSWTLIQVLGLLVEESRTNLIPGSDTSAGSWAGGGDRVLRAATGLPGVFAVGASLARDASVFTFNYYQSLSPVAGTAYTFSVFVRFEDGRDVNAEFGQPGSESTALNPFTFVANGTLFTWSSINKKHLGGGLWRLSRTLTPSDTLVRGWGILIRPVHKAGLPRLFVTGYQLEVGSFPTSHIPTTSSQVTRAADVATVADATDWRSPEGTFVLEHDAPSTRQLLSSGANLLMTSQGTGKIAVSFTAGGSLVCYNGGTPVAGPALTFDTALKLMGGAATFANAHAQRLDFIPRALTNSELQAITS